MKSNHKDAYKDATPGFAIKILPDTELGSAMLLAGDAPVGIASSINEAHEIAAGHAQRANGAVITYKLWARGLAGEYRMLKAFTVQCGEGYSVDVQEVR